MPTNPFAQRLQDLPGLRQLLLLLALAGAVAAGLWAFSWSQAPAYTPLFSGLENADSAAVADALRAAQIPFRLENDGSIAVPEAQLHDARLKLAAQGLPEGARGGFEMIEGEQGFGTSQFIEGARYQHALEIELARTIGTLKPVREARVHLALPKQTAFATQRQPAGASIVLDLYPGRILDDNQIAAIVHLVSNSIPELAPERVTVVDQSGRLLTQSDPDSEAAISAQQFEQARRLEQAYVQRVVTLLEPMTGAGRVSAQVAVDMDFSESEEARESFTPDPAKIRSEQTSEQSSGANANATGANAPAAGVPGATSNTPPAAGATAQTAQNSQSLSRTATRNFELDRTVSHTRQPGGRVKRVTAAVIIDHIANGEAEGRALTAEEVTKIEGLVRQAVGFDEERGDAVSVMNAPFVRAAAEQAPDDAPLWQNPVLKDGARLLAGLVIVLVLLFAVLRPALRGLLGAPSRREHLPAEFDALALAGAGGGVSDAVLIESGPNARERYQERLRLAREAVAQDPKKVAQVMKGWVGNGA